MAKATVGSEECYFDGYLLQNLTRMKEILDDDFDCVIVVDGGEGCLTGDTMINTNRFTLGRPKRLDVMYAQLHNNPFGLKLVKQWRLEEPTFVRSFNGQYIGLHKINDVIFSGNKKVFKLLLEDDKSIKATSNHKFLTKQGWKSLSELSSNDKIMVDTLNAKSSKRFHPKLYDVQLAGLRYHPYSGKRYRIEFHRLIYEAKINQLDFLNYLDIICNEEQQAKSLVFVNPLINEIHHKDGNHYNNSIENLQLMTHQEHRNHHAINGFGYKNFHQGIPSYSKVISIIELGIEPTFDIVCDEPYHNFVANGIVAHNSGKSTLAMQIGKFLDNSLVLDRVVFSAEDFMKAVHDAQKKQCVIYDEAYTGMSSHDTMNKVNKVLTKLLVEIRQKNLVIIIIAPSFFDLSRYISLWRSRCVIHCKLGGDSGFQRGYFDFYNSEKKKLLYVLGKKLYDYRAATPNFFGRFVKKYVLDEVEYRAKKAMVLNRYQADAGKTDDVAHHPKNIRLWRLARYLNDTHKMNYTEIARIASSPDDFITDNSIQCGVSRLRAMDALKVSELDVSEKV